MWFTRVSIHNPVFATMLMAALVVLGIYAYSRLTIEQFPDVTFPVVVVQTEYPGAAPEAVEIDVTSKIEESVATVSGIKTITSRSYEGISVVIIEFDLAVDSTQATQDVRDKIALIKARLRSSVGEPKVLRFDPSAQPIYSVALTAKTANQQLYDIASLSTIAQDVVKKRLQAVRGVGAVNVIGAANRQLQINLQPRQMESLGVSVAQITQAISSNNRDYPAGSVLQQSREQSIQIKNTLAQRADFEALIVAQRNGIGIRLGQVATVTEGNAELASKAFFNGVPAVALDILKTQDQNTITVVQGLEKNLVALNQALAKDYPGLQLETVRDGARGIRLSVNNVKQTIYEGALLTILIVFLFLNSWRSTVITALTLPISLIGTFFFMYLFGFSINMITLMALSLCVGLLIDDAIVVRENIVRHARMGKGHVQAALEGTQEIGLAVLATTLSIVAVFLPIGFMGGIIGRFFQSFGITLVCAVLISMLVSFTLDPMLSAVWPDPNDPRSRYARYIAPWLSYFERLTERLGLVYQRVLQRALNHRRWTLFLSLLLFLFSLFLATRVGSEFVPQADNAETQISFYTPAGSSLTLTESKVMQVQSHLADFPEIQHSYATINTGSASGKNYASIYLRLISRKERARSVTEINAALRQRLQVIGGITVTNVAAPGGPAGGAKPIQLSIKGPLLDELGRYSQQVEQQLASIEGLVDIDSSYKLNKPVLAVTLERQKVSDAGVSTAQVADLLEPLFSGQSVGTWTTSSGADYDIYLRLPQAQRQQATDVARLSVSSNRLDALGQPIPVPLSSIATISETVGASQINRRDQIREVLITAGVNGRAAGSVAADVEATLKQINFRSGYSYEIGGASRDAAESAGFALSALALAIIFIYMVLASQFGSFLQPFAIMASLPLTLIGVFGALLLFGSTLNIFSMIGIVMLMGLVTKNAILLIDYANISRRQGLTVTESLLAAAKIRLRPILMTTLAMILGMVPLAFSISEGSETRAPLGQAVIGGVITSSLLTLVVVPVVYSVIDELLQRYRRSRAPKAAI